VEDIDVAMQLGAGHPMGPLHLVGRERGREGGREVCEIDLMWPCSLGRGISWDLSIW